LLKAYTAAGMRLPRAGTILLTFKQADKRAIVAEARTLVSLGYDLVATDGTFRTLRANGVPCERINKVHEGRPHIVDALKNREIDLVFNTPYGKQQRYDDSYIRSTAVNNGVPCITTLSGARALVSALSALHRGGEQVRSIQEHHAKLPAPSPDPVPVG
jgi:carbamoyl-phosphate synthase large subunit